MALERRRPLKPGKALTRGRLERRARLSPVSDRRAEENRERRRALEARYGRYPACQLGPVIAAAGYPSGAPRCAGDAQDAHEVLTRGRGGSITDLANIVPACRPCHDWVTTHPAEALALGLVATGHRPAGELRQRGQ